MPFSSSSLNIALETLSSTVQCHTCSLRLHLLHGTWLYHFLGLFSMTRMRRAFMSFEQMSDRERVSVPPCSTFLDRTKKRQFLSYRHRSKYRLTSSMLTKHSTTCSVIYCLAGWVVWWLCIAFMLLLLCACPRITGNWNARNSWWDDFLVIIIICYYWYLCIILGSNWCDQISTVEGPQKIKTIPPSTQYMES